MNTSKVDYTDCLEGQHGRPRHTHPLAKYFGDRGARVSTNVFHDPQLDLGADLLDNLRRIVASGRRQEFERLDICIPKTAVSAYGLVARNLMVLKRVIIDSLAGEDEITFVTHYPDVIWAENSYWRAKARTSHHPRQMSEGELGEVLRCCALPERTYEQDRLLLKALDLDD